MDSNIDYRDSHIYLSSSLENQTDIAYEALIEAYRIIESYINLNPLFGSSYQPVSVEEDAHPLIRVMADAAKIGGVGPMAGVAGAFAQYVGEKLVFEGGINVVVENGGDIYLNLHDEKIVSVFSGESRLSNKLKLRVKPDETPLGICTSGSSIGHSVSFGFADAVTVFSNSTAVADVVATLLANNAGVVNSEKLVAQAKEIPEIKGFIALISDEIVVWGDICEVLS